jgi:hypothetical protein
MLYDSDGLPWVPDILARRDIAPAILLSVQSGRVRHGRTTRAAPGGLHPRWPGAVARARDRALEGGKLKA